jgi:xanthine dehydrogenase YagS FAD-binding subunit
MHHGENRFAAVFEQSPCWAVHPSDLAPVLVALGATAEVRSETDAYTIAIEDLLRPPEETRRTESVLGPGDLITSVQVPTSHGSRRMTYRKAIDRKVWAFALVGVAVVLDMEGSAIRNASIVLGGVANVPARASAAETMLAGATITPELAASAADAAFDSATPLEHNAYKLTLGKALLRQALLDLTG